METLKMEGQSQKRGVEISEAKRGKSEQYSEGSTLCVIHRTSGEEQTINSHSCLMEFLVSKDNMEEAYRRVTRNKGAPGVDGLTTDKLLDHLHKCWNDIKKHLLEGSYQPQAVKRVEIPKPNGGVRKLGIPTVVDRLIQQAIHQTIIRLFEPNFSDFSYGFRPGRQASMAVNQAKKYIREGRRWMIDMDLEKFFDKVNHDILMERVRQKVSDTRVLTLIRKYLRSGIMEGGIITTNEEGTPQGGPLSPLLSNIILDDLDKELERRGHKFCRYADDCNIYVNSEKAGYRVFESITKFIERKLQLKVNRDKSGVDRPWRRKFLGFSFTSLKNTTIRVHEKSRKSLRDKIKSLCRVGRGMNMEIFIQKKLNPIIRGWANYFRKADTTRFASELDKYVRRRLLIILWRQWGTARTRYRKLAIGGIPLNKCFMMSCINKGPYRMSSFTNFAKAYSWNYFYQKGLISIFHIVKNG